MNKLSNTPKFYAAIAFTLLLMVSGCGTTAHDATFTEDISTNKYSRVKVGEVTDVAPKGSRGEQSDFDAEGELRRQLQSKLSESGILATGAAGEQAYVLNAEITDYDPGSAGKRWLWPGYGSTELSVQGTLYDGDKRVGNVFARRTVEFGGAYTIGAWKGVFEDVAEDIVEELKEELQ